MLLPSLHNGSYATTPDESEYPHQWRRLSLAWVFGMQPSANRIYDFSGNHLSGTVMSATAWGSGKYGRTPIFTGSNRIDAIRNPASVQIGTTDFSVCMWIRATVSGVNQRIYEHSQAAGGLIITIRNVPGVRVSFDSGPTIFTIDSGSTAVDDGRWYHYALTLDRDGFARSYINGRLNGTPLDISSAAADNPLNTVNLSIPATAAAFTGQMDDVRVYKRVLQNYEIQEIYSVPYAAWQPRRRIYAFTVFPVVEDQVIETAYETPIVVDILADATAGTHAIDPATLDLDPVALARQTTFEDVGKGLYEIDDLGNLTFTPDSDFSGVSTCDFTVQDTEGNISNVGTITVTVAASVSEGRQTVFEDVGKGLYEIDDFGNLTFTPDAGFFGVSTCEFAVEDTEGNLSNIGVITVTVLEEEGESGASAQRSFALTGIGR